MLKDVQLAEHLFYMREELQACADYRTLTLN